MSRVCSAEGCDKALHNRNKSGLCRACNARAISQRADVQAAKGAAIRKHYASPLARKIQSEAMRKSWDAAGEDRYEISRANGRKRAASWTPETRARSHDRRLAKIFPWLPAAYRPLFRTLRDKRYSIEDCRRLIAHQIAADRAKVRAPRAPAPSTFAEKLARFEAGQGAIVPAMPSLHLTPTIRRAA